MYTLLFVLIGTCSGIEYTVIHNYADLRQHIGEFNVWFRILTLMRFYCFSLFLVPYDWRKSSADRCFIMKYALGFCLIGILHFAIHISHVYWLALIHQIVWITFFLYVTYYELYERLQAPQTTLEDAEETTTGSTSDRLWEQTIIMLNSNDKWRNPELSLTSLAEQLESNRTYVGYRQRFTAYRNIPNRIHREHQALSPSTLPNITPLFCTIKWGIFVSIPHHAPKVQKPVLQKSIVVF